MSTVRQTPLLCVRSANLGVNLSSTREILCAAENRLVYRRAGRGPQADVVRDSSLRHRAGGAGAEAARQACGAGLARDRRGRRRRALAVALPADQGRAGGGHAKANRLTTAVGLQARVNPAIMLMREQVATRITGEVMAVHVSLLRDGVLSRPWHRPAVVPESRRLYWR